MRRGGGAQLSGPDADVSTTSCFIGIFDDHRHATPVYFAPYRSGIRLSVAESLSGRRLRFGGSAVTVKRTPYAIQDGAVQAKPTRPQAVVAEAMPDGSPGAGGQISPPSEMSSLIDGLLDAAWLVEPRSLRVLVANAQAAALLGTDVASLCRTDALALAATPQDVEFWEAARRGEVDPADTQTVLSAADGTLLPVLRRVTRIDLGALADARHGVYLVVMRDRGPELRAQAELEERLAQLRATLDSTTDGILVLDLQGRIVNFNPRFAALWELPEPLLAARDDAAVAAWMLRRVADPVVYSKRLQSLADSPELEGTDVLTLRNDKVFERRTLPQRVQGQIIGRVYAFREVTEKREVQSHAQPASIHDPLTGLPSRQVLADRIDYALALAQRDGSTFALMHLNLDRFKPINEALGTAAGDRLLIEVAQRLRATLRQVDTVCRLGDDEFLMLLHQADMQKAEGAARRVLEALKPAFIVDGVNLTITASMGVALYPSDGAVVEELIQAADAAMTDLKAAGGAGYRLHQQRTGATVVALRTHAKLDQAMQQALAAGRFRLHYQPQVDLKSGEIMGAEALIRWRDPELGDVAPGEFIPVAERSGFIVAIGNWVLRQAVQQAAQWRDQGRALLMSINVSALQFQQADFVDSVARALAEVGLEPQKLELELTESILIQDAQEALHRLQALSELGVKLAIDDFGTGYSSLAYLKRFPISRLKIDRSFIQGLPGDEVDVGIVSAIVNLGRALRLDMVAEGVETEEQRQFMLKAGCTQYQGGLCAPPLDAISLEVMLDRGPDFEQDLPDAGGWIGSSA